MGVIVAIYDVKKNERDPLQAIAATLADMVFTRYFPLDLTSMLEAKKKQAVPLGAYRIRWL